jgi:hypothetical protein
VLCYATASALGLLAALDAPVAEAAVRYLAPLDRPRTLQLIGLLDAIRTAAASSLQPPSKPARTTFKH